MIPLPGLLLEPWAQHLAWALLHFLWQGAAVAALLAIALRLAGTPERRYALCMLAIAFLAACPVGTFLFLHTTSARLANSQIGAAESTAFVQQPDVPSAAPFLETATESRLYRAEHKGANVAQGYAWRWQPWLLVVWVMGVVLLGSRLLGGYLHTFSIRRGSLPLPPALAVQAQRLGRRLGLEAARVVQSAKVFEAVAVGCWRPVVLLPVAWIAELPPDVLEAVIAHELAHIRRQDLWVMLLQRIVETLLFYHPAVWWVSRRMSLEREMCCDELAVRTTGQRLVYAQALETIGRRLSTGRAMALAAPVTGESPMNLLKRVRSLLGLHTEREAGLDWPAGLLILLLALGTAVWSMSIGQASQDRDSDLLALADKSRDRDDDDGDDDDDEDRDDDDDEDGDDDDDEDDDEDDGDNDDDEEMDRPAKNRKSGDREADDDDDDDEGDDDDEDMDRESDDDEGDDDDEDGDDDEDEDGDDDDEDMDRRAQKRKPAERESDDDDDKRPGKKKSADRESDDEGAKSAKARRTEDRDDAGAKGKGSAKENDAAWIARRKLAVKDPQPAVKSLNLELKKPAVKTLKPETDREAALLKMIQELRDEVAQLRKEVSQIRGAQSGKKPLGEWLKKEATTTKKSAPRETEKRKPAEKEVD